ncbi:DHS-like NAD/FAD-binding domain-containing protein [Wolfiporia cocos MD-104 SS10]|uniref:DHS-like NAD/FAD-binding domain-containing protein n=1 Tax=Wolfiporia cocos (strain MD-104) TaxID=742152 RepID=A0A2H3J591_WOLCO|nr:DHS-like NAD/FAD-binding domain-containing protein [Wolfiporia cocos MD-104 SS10]
MSAFRDVLSRSKRIIAVAGAGLSAASGIPTFRGARGMWRKYDAISLATPAAFKENPSRVWQFYHYRRTEALQAQPNAAHHALAMRALDAAAHNLGSTAPTDGPGSVLLEMHGRLFDVVCTAYNCRHRELNFSNPICPALAGTEDLMEAGVVEPDVPLSDPPMCSKCGALAQPGVVWFTEVPHYMDQIYLDKIEELVDAADLCIVVGTSYTVHPAASFASMVQVGGGKVAVFNIDHSDGDDRADFLLLSPCEETLPKALGITMS